MSSGAPELDITLGRVDHGRMTLPGLLPVSLLILSGVLAALIPVVREINFGTVKEWQVLIGFTGTIIAGVVAWLNVGRQIRAQRTTMRMNLLSREEDRIEEELPQLRAAGFFLVTLAQKINDAKRTTDAVSIIRVHGLAPTEGKRQSDMIKVILPDANDRIVREVSVAVSKAVRAAWTLSQSTSQFHELRDAAKRIKVREPTVDADEIAITEQAADDAKAAMVEAIEAFRNTGEILNSQAKEFVVRIRQREKTLIAMRSEMERYFSG